MIPYQHLIEAAYRAKEFAYAPYSGFSVGSALLTASDKLYTGCNVECASYSGTICAERTALCQAVSEGERTFQALAVVGEPGSEVFPCGICRQVLAEFGGDLEVIVARSTADYRLFRLSQLLPHAFALDKFNRNEGDHNGI